MVEPATVTTVTTRTATPTGVKPRRVSAWVPDPRWSHPVAGAGWCFALGHLPRLGVSPAGMAALGVACGLAACARAGRSWEKGDYGPTVVTDMRVLSVVAGVAAAGWLVWAARVGPVPALGWLIAAGAVLGLVYAVLRTSAGAARDRIEARWRADDAAGQQTQRREMWREILERASIPLVVADIRDTAAGYVVAVEPAADSTKTMTLDSLKMRIPDLTTHAAVVLARAGIEVRAQDIRPEETDVAHVHLIHVCTNRVETQTLPYAPLEHPTTGMDPIDIGHFLDGQVIEVSLGGEEGAKSGWVIGATGCIAAETRIYLPDTGEHVRVDVLAERGEPVTVLAWNGDRFIRARSDGAPYLKGTAQLFEVRCSGGATLRVTSEHRLLTPQGWQRLDDVRVGHQVAAATHVAPPSAALSPFEWLAGARRWWRIAAGWMDRCSTCRRPCDPPPRQAPTADRACFASPSGARARTLPCLHWDAPVCEPGCSRPCLSNSRLSMIRSGWAGWRDSCVVCRTAAGWWPRSSVSIRDAWPFPRWIDRTRTCAAAEPHRGVCAVASDGSPPSSSAAAALRRGTASTRRTRSGQRSSRSLRESGRLCSADTPPPTRWATRVPASRAAESLHLEPSVRTAPCPLTNPVRSQLLARWIRLRTSFSLRRPTQQDNIKWDRIRTIRAVGTAPYFDLSVPGPENYVAEGIVHHNSGKSVLGRTYVGRAGETVDFLVGVIAVSKLVPFAYPWLRPWIEGRTDRPALDFVAGQNPSRALEALAMVWRYVCEINATSLGNVDVHQPTSGRPGMVVFIEEAGKAATLRAEKVTTHDGRTVDFSELLKMICSESRSAQVKIVLINQAALYDSFGAFGAEIARNTPERICLRTLSFSDGPNTLPALSGNREVDTTKLRNHTALMQSGLDADRAMPFKAYNLTPGQVHDVAVRNAAHRPHLDADLTAVLGLAWSARWDADRLPELVGKARRDGYTWPGGGTVEVAVMDEIDRELQRMLDQEQPTTPPSEPGPGPAGMPDAEAGIAELREAAARMATPTLPEPLLSVMRILADPRAPKEFVSTRQLAILIDRVDPHAPEPELKEAARKLGRELAALDSQLRTEQRDRLMGYPVPLLRSVARRLGGGQ